MKKMMVLLIATMLLMSFMSVSFADVIVDNDSGNPNRYKSKAEVTAAATGGKFGKLTPKDENMGLDNTANMILGVMQWIGYVIAVGMIIFCGIKYLMSGAGEKAKVKDTLVPLLIGAILIAGASTIAGAITTIK